MSKRKAKAVDTEAAGGESVKTEPTTRAYALVREPDGYRYVQLELPNSVRDKHATRVDEPDLLELSIARIEDDIRRHWWA